MQRSFTSSVRDEVKGGGRIISVNCQGYFSQPTAHRRGNWPAERTKDLGVEKEWVIRKIRQKNVAPLKRVVLLSALCLTAVQHTKPSQ